MVIKLSFNERCYKALKKVPKGKVTTYGALARAINSKAYRAVGNAMNKNPYAPKVPCHRVIKSDGTIGGFASGTKKKIKMLKKEGVEIKKGKQKHKGSHRRKEEGAGSSLRPLGRIYGAQRTWSMFGQCIDGVYPVHGRRTADAKAEHSL